MDDEFWYSNDKLGLLRGYKQFFREHGATHLVTFVFNKKKPTRKYAEQMLNKWHKKVDKKLFGNSYHKLQRNERTSFIAILENKEINLHYHAFLVTPKPKEFEANAQAIWKKLVRSGNLHLGNHDIDDEQIAKWVNYVDYELMCENNMDSIFFSKANPTRKGKK